jgi:hypothetical protein
MAQVSVIGAYIKRRGNLVLLGEEQSVISSKELEYCLGESGDHLNLCGIHTAVHCPQCDRISLETAITAYDFFENVMERLLQNLTAVLVNLSCCNGTVNMRLQLGCTCEAGEGILEGLSVSNGYYTCHRQDEDLILDLTITEGGAQV